MSSHLPEPPLPLLQPSPTSARPLTLPAHKWTVRSPMVAHESESIRKQPLNHLRHLSIGDALRHLRRDIEPCRRFHPNYSLWRDSERISDQSQQRRTSNLHPVSIHPDRLRACPAAPHSADSSTGANLVLLRHPHRRHLELLPRRSSLNHHQKQKSLPRSHSHNLTSSHPRTCTPDSPRSSISPRRHC